MKRNRLPALLLAVLLLLTAAGCASSFMDMESPEEAPPVFESENGISGGGYLDYKEPDDYGMLQEPTPSPGSAGGDYLPDESFGPDGSDDLDDSDASTSGTPGSVYQNSGAKLIRRAELRIQTTEFDSTVDALEQKVAEAGGYFETSSVYGGSWRDTSASRSAEYVVRVPAEKYDSFLDTAGDLGHIASSTESSEDVGEQYYDTEARLKTQKTKQERLLALLEKAETMDEIIALETALSEVEYEIELLSSTLNRYDALISFATIEITLDEVTEVTEEPGVTASLWSRMAAGFRASFRRFLSGAEDLLTALSYNFTSIVVLVIIVTFIVLLVRRIRSMRGKKKGRKKPPKHYRPIVPGEQPESQEEVPQSPDRPDGD